MGDDCNYYLPELGKNELGSPDFTLAAETVGTDQFQPIKMIHYDDDCSKSRKLGV